MLTLEQALRSLDENSLDILGENLQAWDTSVKARKVERRALLARHMRTSIRWHDAAKNLPPEAQALLLTLLIWPSNYAPKTEEATNAAAILYEQQMGKTKGGKNSVSEKLNDAFKLLLNSGMVFNTPFSGDPDSITEHLPGMFLNSLYRHAERALFWERDGWRAPLTPAAEMFPYLHPDIDQMLKCEVEPSAIRNDGLSALYDLVQLLCAAEHPGLRLTQKGPLYKKDQDLLEARLLVHDKHTVYNGFYGYNFEKVPLRQQFLLAWAAGLGLIEVNQDGTALQVGRRASEWMDLSPQQQYMSLVEIWRTFWAPAAPGMSFILCALAAVPHRQWLDLSALISTFVRFLKTLSQTIHIWEYFPRAGGTLRITIAALVYLGQIEIGAGEGCPSTEAALSLLLHQDNIAPGAVLVRLTDHGRSALVNGSVNQDFPITDEPQYPLIVQPNFEVVVKPYAPLAWHWYLTMVTDLVRPDQAYVYRITRNSITRAMRAGWTEKDVLDLLQDDPKVTQNATTPPARQLPQNVAYSIHDWCSGYGRCTVMRIAVVQCESELLADQILAQKSLQDLVIGRVSPTMLLVRDDALKRVIAQLEKAGLPPPAEPVYIVDKAAAEKYGMSAETVAKS